MEPAKCELRSKCHTVNIFSSARVLARYGSQTAKQCFCAKGHSPGWAGMDLSRGIKPRPAMKPPKCVRTADQLFRICTHRRDRYRDPQLLRFALHAGPNRWCASRRGVNGEVRDVSAIVWAYYRTDRCIQTSPHRLAGGEAHRWLAHNKQSTGTA